MAHPNKVPKWKGRTKAQCARRPFIPCRYNAGGRREWSIAYPNLPKDGKWMVQGTGSNLVNAGVDSFAQGLSRRSGHVARGLAGAVPGATLGAPIGAAVVGTGSTFAVPVPVVGTLTGAAAGAFVGAAVGGLITGGATVAYDMVPPRTKGAVAAVGKNGLSAVNTGLKLAGAAGGPKLQLQGG